MKVKEKNAMEMTSEEVRREALQAAHWDIYKDVYGFRPRHIDYSAMSMAELEEAVAAVERALVRAIEDDKQHEKFNIIRFEKQVTGMIADFDIDRDTAIRWIHEAEGTTENGMLEYHLGLPHGYLYGHVVKTGESE